MTGLMGLTPLESLVARMLEVRSSWLQVGGPDRIAGDPAGMRNLAGRHRAVAARLSAARMDGRDQARALLGGPWRGEASERFERYWGGLEGRLAELAAAHEELAGLLEESAATAEGLNSEARALWSSAESWLSEAEQAVSRLDAGAVPRLLTEGMALVPRFDRLLRQAAVLAGETGRRLMTPRLDFSRRPVGVHPPALRTQPPIDMPPAIRSLLTDQPLQRPGGSPMTQKGPIRPGPWRRRGPFPDAPIGQEPVPGPQGRARGPGAPRQPREPMPPPGAGGGGVVVVKGGATPGSRSPRLRGGSQVPIATSGPPPRQPPAVPGQTVGPAPTHIEAQILPLVTIGALIYQQVKRALRRRKEGGARRREGSDRQGRDTR